MRYRREPSRFWSCADEPKIYIQAGGRTFPFLSFVFFHLFFHLTLFVVQWSDLWYSIIILLINILILPLTWKANRQAKVGISGELNALSFLWYLVYVIVRDICTQSTKKVHMSTLSSDYEIRIKYKYDIVDSF